MIIKKPKAKKPKKVSHRIPPKPVHWNCKRGTCRFCGEAIIENDKVNGRKHWHQPCADLWRIMNNPSEASFAIKRRDNWTCQHCGLRDRAAAFEVDHRKPLYEANGDHSYWQPDNLVLLCVSCHREKTKSDMVAWRALQSKANPPEDPTA